LPKAISISQMATVLETTQGDDWISLRDKALLELMYATGARVSEAAALNVDDIFDGTGSGIADVVRLFGKGGKQRLVPLGRFAREALDSYLVRVRPALAVKGKAGPALFLGERGSRLSRQSIWLIIQARFAQSNIGVHASPHTFRHSFATHMLEGGADIKVVQELLGHSSISTTQIYTLVTADTLREVYLTSHPRSHRRQVDSQSD
ncbi:MAG: tyrosine-type recombinase/integrase, partial [Microbacteriaceae bacterium]|nr:tyrosine-type recombinase/integrase [Microbacteriaceae bacterium]